MSFVKMHGRFGASVTGGKTTIISSFKNSSNFCLILLKDKVTCIRSLHLQNFKLQEHVLVLVLFFFQFFLMFI